MTDSGKPMFSGDRPGSNPEQDDTLGYAPFAKNLSAALVSMMPEDGLVIAVYAPWGAGKTTVLNFIEHYLGQQQQGDEVVVVHFNPWWFTGDENLVRHFFDQLNAAIQSQEQRFGKDARKAVAGFAEAISDLPLAKIIGFVTGLHGVPDFNGLVKAAAKFLKEDQKDVAALKAEATEALRRQCQRVLVVIDDIDRLTAEETRQLFRVVKAIADFPYVVYLMAFDKEVAIRALGDAQNVPGDAYLEKIVQVPFELPLPDRTSLRQMLFKRLEQILQGVDHASFDQSRWSRLYMDGIDPFVQTPRDVVRLTNSVAATFPAISAEVNPVDFLAVEALRVFASGAYDIIRRNEGMFAGPSGNSMSANQVAKAFHDGWIGNVDEKRRKAVKELTLGLFPKLGSVWGNLQTGAESAQRWRVDRRVCSAENFQTYFRLALPAGAFSHAEIEAALRTTASAEGFAELLTGLSEIMRPDGITRAKAFLERLEDYTEKGIPQENLGHVIKALYEVGDELDAKEPFGARGFLDLGIEMNIGRITWQVLGRMDEEQRFEVLSEAVTTAKAIGFVVREVAVLGQQHGKFGNKTDMPESEILISPPHLMRLEQLAVARIRAAAADGSLLRVRTLSSALYSWKVWDGAEGVTAWVSETIKDDDKLLALLVGFLSIQRSQGSGEYVVRNSYHLSASNFDPFVTREVMSARVAQVSHRVGADERQRTAVDSYLSTQADPPQREAGDSET